MHSKLASNTLYLADGGVDLPGGNGSSAQVAIFPSSPESGLATVYTRSPDDTATLLSIEDVVALRDWLNLALDQARGDSPFQVLDLDPVETLNDIIMTARAALVDLDDENEGQFREHVAELATDAARLDVLARSW